MKKILLVLAIVLCSHVGAGATEWSTPEALRAFGEPGDTVKEAPAAESQHPRKSRKSSKARVEKSDDATLNVTPTAPRQTPNTTAPARPVTAETKTVTQQPGTPALQKELNAVYGKYYAATRAANFNEQLKYVTGEQKRLVEKVLLAPSDQREMVKEMMGKLARSYVDTGCSIAPDGKSATLNTRRKVQVYNAKGEKTREQDCIGNVEFIKVGSTWKISMVVELS